MKFSIVIITFNGELYVEEAILSALAQIRSADEVIISDDNSSDRTIAICEKYRGAVKIYKNESGPAGYANAFNRAATIANGDFVVILHQDDKLLPKFLLDAELVLISNPDVLHLFTTCCYIDKNGSTFSYSYQKGDGSDVIRYKGIEYVRAYQQLGSPHIHRCPGVITHKSIFEYCKYNHAAGHILDDDFFYRVGQYTDVIGLLRPLACYRHHGDSGTGYLEDHKLVDKLADDYIFQCAQWKNDPFIEKDTYQYFTRKARKFIGRGIGYGFRLGNYSLIYAGLKRAIKLYKVI